MLSGSKSRMGTMTRLESGPAPARDRGEVTGRERALLVCLQSAASADGLKCKVCNSPYEVQETTRVAWEQGLTPAHWTRTALAVASMCGAGAAAWLAGQLFASTVVRVLAVGMALLVFYLALRTLGMSTVTAYQRAKVSSLHIISEPVGEASLDLPTISNTVTVEIASKAALERALKGEVDQ
ncbi:hypothetical protein EVAR_40509_1 [Eumeta japonica]|uniref:Uncharacterized protein n=1 Tax=Eumeta variegata TaxID=151549 RepID=A0A4C1XVY6_EUMVA|nr:hypothetical protein EVAR_40509_1 [Eumeta japonica]